MWSPEHFRSAFEHSTAGLAIASPQGIVLEANESYAGMLGVRREDVIGGRIADVTHPDDVAETAAFFRTAVAGGPASTQFEKRFVHADGSIVHALVSATLVRDADGAPEYVTAQVLDLTARKTAERTAARERQRQQLVLDNLPGTIIVLYDLDLRILEVEGLPDGPGVPAAETMRGAHVTDFFAPEAADGIVAVLQAAAGGTPGSMDTDHPAGLLYHLTAAPFVEDGVITGVLSVWHDVTAQRQTQRELAGQHAFVSAVIETVASLVVVLDRDGRITRFNRACEELSGRPAGAVVGQVIWETGLLPAADVPGARAAVATLLVGDVNAGHRNRWRTADGTTRLIEWANTSLVDDAGVVTHVIATGTDVTERKRFEERLRHMADHDALTGLANRRRFEEALGDHVAHCARYGNQGALMVLDIDGFKGVNDRLGHAAGDTLLVGVADVLRARLRGTDTVARLGGDEFAVLLPRADAEQARCVAAKLVAALREAAVDREHRITVSIGIRLFATGRLDAEDAMVDADRAMYRAKTAGRDGFAFHVGVRFPAAAPVPAGVS